MLDIFLLGTCRWSELLMYFGSFALKALKFKFFVGRLIANKHLPITDNCQKLKQKRYRKSKTNQYTLGKQKETKLKRKTKTKNKRRKKKQKEIICHQIASSLKDLSLDG